MVVRRLLGVGLLLLAGVAPAAPAPKPAKPVREEGPAEMWQPMTEAMERLGLTDLQRRILAQVFHPHAHETPPPPAADAPLAVEVDPAVPGGVYRMGPGGDLPVRLRIRVRTTGRPGAVRLRYLVQDFYGRKVAGADLRQVFPDAAGKATADLAIEEATVAGYYHVLVTATGGNQTAAAAYGAVVVPAPLEGPNAESTFGLLAPPGPLPDDVPTVAHRLGAAHLAMDWDGTKEPLEAVRSAGLVPAPVVPIRIPQREPSPEVFAATTAEALAPLAEAVPAWHLGRRPTLDRDALAGSVASYRRTVAGLLQAVRRGESPAGLWVGTTPAVLGSVLTEGPVLAGADGVVLYADAAAEATSLRSGAYQRSVDYGVQMAKRMGVDHAAVVTAAEEPGARSPQQRAWKLVTRQVTALAAGAERVFFQWGRGLPEPQASAAVYAWMAHLLADAAYEGDAWDDVPLLHAHVFSTPQQRAAVVWSWVGGEDGPCDRGVLVFEDGLGLQAMDVVGHPVGIWKGKRLIVPLSEAPVYVVSVDLSAGQLRERLRKADILGIAPGTVRVESIIRGRVPGKARVTLWVQSHRPWKLAGQAGLLLPDGWEARDDKRRFDLEAGHAGEVSFECEAPEDAGRGPYPVEAVVSLNEAFVRHRQQIWRAQTPKRTIEVGFGLSDWDGIDPVVLEGPDGDVGAEVRTAWDETFFYVAVSVRRERGTFQGGPFAFEGDAVQLAWGAAEGRADDDFGHPARGWALPAGAFRDTDHLMALTFGGEGPQVVRLRRPGAILRAHMPGNLDPWYGPVEGAVADIARDHAIGHTLYEAAIPWEALAPLVKGRDRIFRFGFRIGNGDTAPLVWGREAGVPEFLTNPCSFLPLSEPSLPCQTWWGMVGERTANDE
ncbi:MAG: hypothetical protein R6X20_17020 [Phycisphaerae bacterium]